jgi:formylglycine-generating enzyme required for sulfatase activity
MFTEVPYVPQYIVSAYQVVRQIIEKICAPLKIEDYGLQAMNDASPEPITRNSLESSLYHPVSVPVGSNGLQQMFGDLWEWTQSPYAPYQGCRLVGGTQGEYNGMFMVNQMVLWGGSCVTPDDRIRPSYRNFFPPDAHWQFSGIRLADEL